MFNNSLGGKIMTRIHLILSILAILTVSSGCASKLSEKIADPATPKTSGSVWTPTKPEEQKPVAMPEANLPPEYADKMDWSLTELIDLALLTNNNTKTTWFLARAAAAEAQSRKGPYYPSVDLSVETTRIRGSAVGGQFTFNQTSTRPFLELNWILYDFGRTKADVDEAKQNLYAANWNHNAELQNVILQVEQAYYQYLGARALLQAQQATVKSAQTNLDAANQRHDAGVATIADVLQAKTALSQAQLSVDTTTGAIQILRGVLAVAIGAPPSILTKLEVVDELPSEIPLEQTSKKVEVLIREAFAKRPDLAAARSSVLAALANVKKTEAERYPSIEFNANADRLYYLDTLNGANNYLLTLAIRFPLFNGFSRQYDVLQAKAEAEAARTSLAALQQQVGLQVWTSYFNLNTATEKIKTTRSLLESASQSYEVALGRYQEGVGSILDLLTAQSALEDARAEDVVTRTQWFLAVAQLARDTGTLGMAIDQSGAAQPPPELKEK
jgi:outer membrane protein TolC